MSDLELLFLVLALVYGWECGWWVKRGSVVFRTWLGRRWRPVHPATLLGNQQAGVIFAYPLPPLGTMLAGHSLPISLSPEAVLAYIAPGINAGGRPAQTGKLFRLDEIRSVEGKGKQVRVDGQLLLKTVSPAYTIHLAQEVQRLAKQAPAERGKAIERIYRESFDAEGIQRRWQEYLRQARLLRLVANVLFGYLFVAAPAVIWRWGFGTCWPGLLIGLLTLTTITAIRFRRAHKSLYPSAEDERFAHFLMILLWPATAMRAHDILSRPLLETFHPLALARVFCPGQQFSDLAQGVLREIRHPALPLSPSGIALAEATEQFSRAALQKALVEFLKESGFEADELLRPPPRADDTCRSYCPRCLAQFTTREGICADCGGLALVAFSGP